jgi:hypothetical protein
VPIGANPWNTNTNKPMSLTAFVQGFYIKSAWKEEAGLYKQRGFVAGVQEGWFNADSTQQEINIARFKTVRGAQSLFDGLTGTFKTSRKPAKMLSFKVIGALGWSSTKLDASGNTEVELAARLGSVVIDVTEWTAAAPDVKAAESLILEQYQSLRNGS